MNDRQLYALAHPLTTAEEDITAYQLVEAQPDGNLLLSILAVDR